MYTEADVAALGATRPGYKKHLEEYPDDSWEEYLEVLEYSNDAEKSKRVDY